jgi:hypothetical protein
MELTKAQSKTIVDLIELWSRNEQYELETTFGPKGVVDSNTFLQIAQHLRAKNFEVLPQDDRLSIITPNRMRFSLQSLGLIESYCIDNNLRNKPFTVMIKEQISKNVQPIDISEYDIRFKIQNETNLAVDDSRVTAVLKSWATQQKAFRIIRRWSFKGKGIRVDMSVVRQSQTDPNTGGFKWVNTFLESNVTKQVPRYEVEVELLHENAGSNDIVLRQLIAGVGEVQRAIQKNSLLIRKSVVKNVQTEYEKLVGGIKFRGVSPITLEIQNMAKEIDETIPNIRTSYNVTDKADGMRAMGFINSQGELYLLDQSLNVYRTGLQNMKCANTLVDGEWVTSLKDGAPINRYLLFDIYIYKNAKVSNLPFITFKNENEKTIPDNSGESRYVKLQELFTNWSNDPVIIAVGIKPENVITVHCKMYKFGMGDQIFDECRYMLDKEHIYYTDGLIITSNDAPIPDKFGVRFSKQFKWKPSKDNTIDFLVHFESDDSSVDKILTTIDENGTTIRYKSMRLYVGGIRNPAYDNPRDTVLSQLSFEDKDNASYRPIMFNPLNFGDSNANTCNVAITYNPITLDEHVLTEHTSEPIQNHSVIEMRYDPSKEPGWRWIPTRIRHDKTERYIRAQAAAQMEGGNIKYTGMMNDDATANSVWNSIHEPITESMIRTGNEEPDEKEMVSISTDMTKKYYDRKAPKENVAFVSGLRDFHNKYIKNEILIRSTMQPGNKRLLDIACGEAGDLYKWHFARASYVMGVDIAENNIKNPHSGAYKRYLKSMHDMKNQRLPKIAFAIGDSSKPIVTGEAGASSEEKNIMRSVFGKMEPDDSLPPYIQTVMKNSFQNGADVVACMFAIHYFFKNMESLNGLLKNLADTVKVGGYFIGCCFDGNLVFNMLKDLDKDESVIGKEGDVEIWKITKRYENTILTDNEKSIGLPIDVNFISIGDTYTEYLVPFHLLVKKCREIGLELLTIPEANAIGLHNSTAMFKDSYDMAKQGKHNYAMPESVKQYSFLNRWFIFKRTAIIASLDLPLVAELPLPPIPAKLDTRIYKKFKDSMIKEDASYANYVTVESSDYSVLKPWHREQVKQVLESWFPNKNEIRSILDGTTHIGVDAIYLSELFPDAIIDAYEIVPETIVALRINIKTFGKQDRIAPHLQDITTWNPNKNVDILFVDPPWGGHGYKKVKKLNLYLQEEGAAPDENKNIKTLLKKWLGSGYVKNIILKVPKNFDVDNLPDYDPINGVKNIYENKVSELPTKHNKKLEYVLMLFTTQVAPPAADATVTADATATAEYIPPIQLDVDEEKHSPVAPIAPVAPVALKELKEYKFGNKNVKNVTNTSSDLLKWEGLLKTPMPLMDFPKNALLWLSLFANILIPDIAENPKIYTNMNSNAPPLIDNYSSIIDTYLTKSKSGSKLYPTLEQYLLGMKIKFASNAAPKTEVSLMSYSSKKFYQPLAAKLSSIDTYSNEYFKEYIENSTFIRKAMSNKNLLSSKIKVYDNVWDMVKKQFIEFAFKYRLQHDELFKNIIASLQKENDKHNYVYTSKNSNALTSEEAIYYQMIIDTINTPGTVATATATAVTAATASVPDSASAAVAASASTASTASAFVAEAPIAPKVEEPSVTVAPIKKRAFKLPPGAAAAAQLAEQMSAKPE